MAAAIKDGAAQVIHGVDVGPGLVGGTLRRLDGVEVDAVRPEVRPAHEHDDLRLALRRRDEGVAQAQAVGGRHGAVVEIEVQEAGAALLLVGNVLPGRWIAHRQRGQRRFGHVRRRFGQSQYRRQLERGLVGFPFGVGEPHRAIHRGAAQRALALRDHRTGVGPTQRAFGVGVEEPAVHAGDAVGEAGKAVRRAQLPQHRRRVVARPVDAALVLLHERALGAMHTRIRIVERHRREVALRKLLHRLQHRGGGGLGHLVAVEAALSRRAHGKSPRRPDVAAVHDSVGLQHGDAPLRFVVHDRPVERRGATVADDARVHHQTDLFAPHRLGNGPLEEGRDDEIGPEQRDRLDGDVVVDVEFDGHLVAARAQLDAQALGEAVEAVREK